MYLSFVSACARQTGLAYASQHRHPTQCGPCVEHPRFSRRDRNSQYLRGFLYGKFPQLMDLHYFSAARPQAPDCLADDFSPFAETVTLFRIRRAIRDLKSWPGIQRRARLIYRNFPYSAFLAQLTQRRIDGDAREPSGKTRAPIKIPEVHKSAQEGVLHRVFRVLTIASDPESHTENHLRMAFTKDAERAAVAALRGGD